MTSVAPGEPVIRSAGTVSISVSRATVIDVAYNRLEVSGRPVLRIGPLVESINDTSVEINGVRRPIAEAWTMALRDVLVGLSPDAVTVAHPTAWGFRRTSLLANAVRAAVGAETTTTMAPRAVLIAESHMEASAQVCVVAECHDGRLDVHVVRRGDRGWAVASTSVFDDDPGDAVAPLVTDAVEAILVDGDNRDRIAATRRLFEDHTPTGRIAAVERVLLHRYGGARLAPPASPLPPIPGSTGGRAQSRIAMVGMLVVVLIAAVVAVIVIAPWHTDSAPDDAASTPTSATTPLPTETTQVGRVSLTVPTGWRRSGDPADANGAFPFTAFAARTDDRRIILVQNAVRADSTLASVAVSLRNRLDQRGTDVVTEFSPLTRYGDRDVIGYRETPVSGGQIRWFVVVESALQVSVGCQDGGQGQSVEAQCRSAVRSVVITP